MIDLQCKICFRICKNTRSLCNHITHSHKISLRNYYDIFLKTEDEGICVTCGRETRFTSLISGYRKFCNCKCSANSKDTRQKCKSTCLKRYGVEYSSQHEETKKKFTSSCIERYGTSSHFQSEKVKEKIKTTNKEKFGVDNPSQNEEIKEKKKKTYIKNYGVEHYSQTKKFREDTSRRY